MKSLVLVAIFFLLTLSLVEKRKPPEFVERTSVVFGERMPSSSQDETSINLTQKVSQGPFHLEINNFAQYLQKVHTGDLRVPGVSWKTNSKLAIPRALVEKMANLDFTLDQKSCRLIYASPTLFNCEHRVEKGFEPISKLRVSGNNVDLYRVKSGIQNETSVSATGELAESSVYVVDFEFQLNKNYYSIRLKTDKSQINTEGAVPNVPVGTASMVKEVSL